MIRHHLARQRGRTQLGVVHLTVAVGIVPEEMLLVLTADHTGGSHPAVARLAQTEDDQVSFAGEVERAVGADGHWLFKVLALACRHAGPDRVDRPRMRGVIDFETREPVALAGDVDHRGIGGVDAVTAVGLRLISREFTEQFSGVRAPLAHAVGTGRLGDDKAVLAFGVAPGRQFGRRHQGLRIIAAGFLRGEPSVAAEDFPLGAELVNFVGRRLAHIITAARVDFEIAGRNACRELKHRLPRTLRQTGLQGDAADRPRFPIGVQRMEETALDADAERTRNVDAGEDLGVVAVEHHDLVHEVGGALPRLAVFAIGLGRSDLKFSALRQIEVALPRGGVLPCVHRDDLALGQINVLPMRSCAVAKRLLIGAVNKTRTTLFASRPNRLAIRGGGTAARGAAGVEGAQILLESERFVQIKHRVVFPVLEILVVENRHAVGTDIDIAERRADRIAAKRNGRRPVVGRFRRRQPARIAAGEQRRDRVPLAIDLPLARGRIDALHSVVTGGHGHEVLVEPVPGFGELAFVFLGDRARLTRDERAHDPVGILRVGNRECDQIGLRQLAVGRQRVGNRHTSLGLGGQRKRDKRSGEQTQPNQGAQGVHFLKLYFVYLRSTHRPPNA